MKLLQELLHEAKKDEPTFDGDTLLPDVIKSGKFKKDYGHIIVPGDLILNQMGLKTFAGCPQHVRGDFEATNNRLVDLSGGPQEVGGHYNVSVNTWLESLKGAPTKGIVGENFTAMHCQALKKFEVEGVRVKKRVILGNTMFTSLAGIHKVFPYIGMTIDFSNCPIEDSVLGLLKIEGLQKVYLPDLTIDSIINDALKQPFGNKRVLEAQSKMLDMGFDDYAQL